MAKMKRVIVTGGNGFVGYWLIRELCKNGVKVTAIIKDTNENISMLTEFKGVDIVYCELAELESLKDKITDRDYDAFYHLAWISAGGAGRADYAIQLQNVKYACDAVGVAKELGCKKILFAGTVTEKIAENILNLSGKAVNNIYGICKHMTHCLVDVESQRQGIDYVWMQFSNLYGPYSINGNIVGYTIKELLGIGLCSFIASGLRSSAPPVHNAYLKIGDCMETANAAFINDKTLVLLHIVIAAGLEADISSHPHSKRS